MNTMKNCGYCNHWCSESAPPQMCIAGECVDKKD
jgi:hypothetical protein